VYADKGVNMATVNERTKLHLERLRMAGGRRVSMDMNAATLAAIEKLKKREKLASMVDVVARAIEEFAKSRK
jgi:hypothetical protein